MARVGGKAEKLTRLRRGFGVASKRPPRILFHSVGATVTSLFALHDSYWCIIALFHRIHRSGETTTQPRKPLGSSVRRLLFRVTNYGVTIYL
jgi:hypothetical protein